MLIDTHCHINIMIKKDFDTPITETMFHAAQEIVRAKETLRDQVSGLVVAGAEQILRREINAQNHSDLLTQFKAQL